MKFSLIEMLLLYLLQESDSDMHGYLLYSLIQKRSKKELEISEQTIYTTLYRLEEKGCLSSKELFIGKRKKRVDYHLKQEGKEYFQKLCIDYQKIQNGIKNFYECEELERDI